MPENGTELLQEENRRMRWLRLQVDILKAVLYQDPDVGIDEARELVQDLRRRVLLRFPDKGTVFDLILFPRFDRIARERWGKGLDTGVH